MQGDIFGSYKILKDPDSSGRCYTCCETCGRTTMLSPSILSAHPLCRHKSDFVHWWQGDTCWVLIPYKNETIKILIDREDWELVSACQCYAKVDTATHEVIDVFIQMESTAISLARYLLISHGQDVEGRQCRRKDKRHLDFRKGNIQLTSSKASKSQRIDKEGVTFSRALQAWVAWVCEKGETISLGAFTDRKDAILTRERRLSSNRLQED